MARMKHTWNPLRLLGLVTAIVIAVLGYRIICEYVDYSELIEALEGKRTLSIESIEISGQRRPTIICNTKSTLQYFAEALKYGVAFGECSLDGPYDAIIYRSDGSPFSIWLHPFTDGKGVEIAFMKNPSDPDATTYCVPFDDHCPPELLDIVSKLNDKER